MQNKLQQAIEELQAQLAGREASIAELSQMVRLQVRAQRWQDAVRWAEQALQLEPRSPECHRLLSEALLGLGMPQESARRLREAIEMFPRNPALQAQLALVQLELKDVDAAWAAMQLPLERQLDLPWVHRAHAMVLERRGLLVEACAAMDLALAGAPKNAQWLAQREAMQTQLEGGEAEVVAEEAEPQPRAEPEAELPLPEPLLQDERGLAPPISEPESDVAESLPPQDQAIDEPERVETDSPDAVEELELPPAPAVDEQASAAETSASLELPPPQRAAQPLPSAKMIMVPRRDLRQRRSGGWFSRLWQRLLG